MKQLKVSAATLWVVFWILLIQAGYSQTSIDLRNQAKQVDFSATSATKPVKTGAGLPATCSAGEMYFRTDVVAGRNLYACTATNTWVVQTPPVSSAVPAGGDTLRWNSSNSQWEPSASVQAQNWSAGDGLTQIGSLLLVDPLVIPRYLVGSGTPTPLACVVGQDLYLDTAAGDLYFCPAENSWTKVLKGDHTHSAADVQSGLLALGVGGTGADLSSTGGAGLVLKQKSTGAPVVVESLQSSDLPSHTHSASDTALGTFANAQISQGSVVQHQGALTLGAEQIASGLMATARLATGTADGTTCLKGDQTWGPCGLGGGGDLTGPATSFDNALPRFDGTTGKTLQSSGVVVDDTNNLTAPGSVATGTGDVEGELRLFEQAVNGADAWIFRAPTSRGASLAVVLPSADPADGQILRHTSPASSVSNAAWSDSPGTGTCQAGQFVSALNHNAAPTCATPVGGAGGDSGGVAGGNPSFSFTAQTAVLLNHTLGTRNLGIACYSSADAAIQPSGWSISGIAPYDITVNFGVAQTGRCVILGGTGKYASSFNAETSVAISGDSHGLGTCDVQITIWDNSSPRQRVSPGKVTCDDTSRDVVVQFSTAQSGRIVIQ